MNANIGTKFVTLIGEPLSQSFAADMQNAAYEAGHINMIYFYTETGQEHLGEIINGIRHMPSFAGCAITKPNKVKVLEYLDELDPLCREIGASNTVVKTEDGRLIGYNTDAMGFSRSLEEDGHISIKDSVCMCIGAGGAGRAICYALAVHGAKKIYIVDKIEAVSRKLAEEIEKGFSGVAEYVPFNDFIPVAECQMVFNATGIGMGKTIGQTPMPKEYIREGQFYYDACYNPEKTQFLLDAEEKGCRVLNGLGMSLYQGVTQIELWSGKKAPIEVMRQELKRLAAR